MDSDKLVVESDIKKTTFLEHVFNFDEDTKSQLMNIVQYAVLAIIPIVVLNKGISKIIPEVDDEKESYLLVLEILGQSLLMFFGIFLVHRFVTYFRTYSETPYSPFHTTNIILLFLFIAVSFQTRIGEKTNILIDRLFDLIEGRTTLTGKTKEVKEVKQDQNPQQQQHQQVAPRVPQHQPSRADIGHAGTTNISQLQSNERGPDFNSMFSGPNNPLQNAHSPGMEAFSEPVAANEVSGSMWNAY